MGRCLSTLPNNQVGDAVSYCYLTQSVEFDWRSAFYQVYTGGWGDHSGIIRCKLGEVVRYELGEEPEPRKETPVFDKPNRGTSVEKFKEMLFNHLKVEEHQN